jgi:plastocyanin
VINITGLRVAVAAVFLTTTAACGGGYSSPTPTSGGATVGSTGVVGTSGATITIGSNGAISPAQVTIAVAQSVTFVNNDTRAHDMQSDPHPSHTACPSIANVGNIQPGQTKLTFGFSAAGSCGFHDHNDANNAALQGRIVIQ